MRRRVTAALALAVASATMQPALAAEDEVAHLSPDSSGRYRPAIADHGSIEVLADIDSITAPVVSPDGDMLAFAGALDDGSLGLYAIFVVNTDGSGLRQITTGSYGELDPAWSPNGSSITAIQNGDGALYDTGQLIVVDVSSEEVDVLTGAVGAARPSFSPNGSTIAYDTSAGVHVVGASGGASQLIGPGGYDPTFSANGSRVFYLAVNGTSNEIRSVPTGGGAHNVIYATPQGLENPLSFAGRIMFTQYIGWGWDARTSVRLNRVTESGGSFRTEKQIAGNPVMLSPRRGNDELLFYRSDGLYQYHDVQADGDLGSTILEGDNYSTSWTSISDLDLDGDGAGEMLFYRATTGTFKYYEMRSNGTLESLILGGSGYSTGWSSITAIDLDGDRRDEIFFYRKTDGAYRYYDIRPDGTLAQRLSGGGGYSTGWSSITAVDLDGDDRDEMLFYRATDGTYKYYEMGSNGSLTDLILGGTGYSTGWSAITAVDLDGDGQDEIFFYRTTGSYRYYNINAAAGLGSPIASGSGYTQGLSVVSAVDLEG